MKHIFLVVCILPFFALAQNYQYSTHFKEGFDIAFTTQTINPDNAFTKKTISWYGILQNKKDVVLPLEYKSVTGSGEPGIFIIENAAGDKGLFNAFTKTIIAQPEYFDISSFSEGLAVVKKRNLSFGFDWGAVDKNGTIVIPVAYDYLGKLSDGLMNFKKGSNQGGFINAANTIVIPATYDNLADFSNGLAAAKDVNGKYGFINKENKMVIAAQYAAVTPFYNGYATVTRKKGGFGKNDTPPEVALINTSGKELTSFEYGAVTFRQPNGLFIVRKGNLYGAVDSTGKLLIPLSYDDITSFGNEYVLLKQNKKYGLANAKGSVVLPVEQDYIGWVTFNKFSVKKNGTYAIMDMKLKTLIPAQEAEAAVIMEQRISVTAKDKVKIYDGSGKLLKTFNQPNLNIYSTRMYADGDSLTISYNASVYLGNLTTKTVTALDYTSAADFNEEGIFLAGKPGLFDFVDVNGKKISTRSYYSAVNFSEGVAAVQDDVNTVPYLVDKNFNTISTLSTQFKGPFSEGLALTVDGSKLVYINKAGMRACSIYGANGSKCVNNRILVVDSYNSYFFYNRNEKPVGEGGWKSALDFSAGLAAVQKGTKWGFIDSTGNYAITPAYDAVSSFYNGAAVAKMNGSFMLIDKSGKKIGTDSYSAAGNPGKGGFPVMKDNKVGLVDSKGKTLVDFKYSNILPFTEDRTWVMKDNKWGLLDNHGKELTGFIYSACGSFMNGFATVSKDGQLGVVDKNGTLVFPLEYQSIGNAFNNRIVLVKGSGEIKVSIK